MFKVNIFDRLNKSTVVNDLIEISCNVLLLFFMAQVRLPLYPIPMTLQTVGVMIIGLQCTRNVALYSVLIYILLGISGLPVFTGFSSGIIRFTFGYLIGFIFAVLIMNVMNQSLKPRYNSFISNLFSCLAGTIAIFIFGVSWLALYLGLQQAILQGLLPFILPGMVKIFILSAALRYLNSARKKDDEI